MTLSLDKRQRAMLREMGVRAWQPNLPAAALMLPTEIAAPVTERSAPLPVPVPVSLLLAQPTRSEANPVPPARPISRSAESDRIPPNEITPNERAPNQRAPNQRAPALAPSPAGAIGWRLGRPQSLYAETAKATGARWLVLVEVNAAALESAGFDPLEGDAGKLLDNMLRAAGLAQAAAVELLPLGRQTDAAASSAALLAELAPCLTPPSAAAQPDVVLVMGRLLAQALLPSGQAFGRLRGQAHSLQGRPLVVTQDAAYLLRKPEEKDRAWDDLCLAMQVAAGTQTD